jgi:hypothetical protein
MYDVVKHTLQFCTIGYVFRVRFYVPTWDVEHWIFL